MDFTSIVCPRNTEHDNALWLYDAFENSILLDFRHLLNNWLKSLKNFLNCLQEFWLILVSLSFPEYGSAAHR